MEILQPGKKVVKDCSCKTPVSKDTGEDFTTSTCKILQLFTTFYNLFYTEPVMECVR